MKKMTFVSLAVILIAAVTSAVPGAERHVRVDFVSSNDSGVTGWAMLTQMPGGGSMLKVSAKGLQPGTVYSSFYYESTDCSAPADLLETFTAGPNGNAHAVGKIDEDLDEVGSVSIRLGTGPEYGTLQACAAMH